MNHYFIVPILKSTAVTKTKLFSKYIVISVSRAIHFQSLHVNNVIFLVVNPYFSTESLSQQPESVYIYYRPQPSWGKVMFLHVSVILFTGVCPIACWDTPPWEQTPTLWTRHPIPLGVDPLWIRHPPEQASPWEQIPLEQTPPTADTPREQTPSWEQTPPWEQTPSPAQCMLGDTGNKWVYAQGVK